MRHVPKILRNQDYWVPSERPMSPTQQGLDTRSARLTASSSCVVSRRLLITCIYKKAFIIHNSELTTIVYPQIRSPIADSQPSIISSPQWSLFYSGWVLPVRSSTVNVQLDCGIRDLELEIQTYRCNFVHRNCCITGVIMIAGAWCHVKPEDLEPKIQMGG